jgi:hypothetical protein
MNINNYIKNNIEITINNSLLDSELNSDENEINIKSKVYNIGCDICCNCNTIHFDTNLFNLIHLNKFNIHELKLNNSNSNNIKYYNYFICKNTIYFRILSRIFDKINKKNKIYKIYKKNKLIEESDCMVNSCFNYFSNKQFQKRPIDSIKEVIICNKCYNMLNCIDANTHDSFQEISSIHLYWRYFIKDILNYITFKNEYEKKYLLDNFEINNMLELKSIIIN